MNKILLLCLTLFFVIVSVNPCQAHSTKGRIKVALDKDKLVINDIAYFAESYVHRHLYKDKYKKAEKRFYVNKFINIEQNKESAVIYFKTLDVKTKNIFKDQITITRLKNGKWVFNPQNSKETIEMFTYIKKSTYYYNKYVLPMSATGLALGLLGFGLLRIKKRKTATGAANAANTTDVTNTTDATDTTDTTDACD